MKKAVKGIYPTWPRASSFALISWISSSITKCFLFSSSIASLAHFLPSSSFFFMIFSACFLSSSSAHFQGEWLSLLHADMLPLDPAAFPVWQSGISAINWGLCSKMSETYFKVSPHLIILILHPVLVIVCCVCWCHPPQLSSLLDTFIIILIALCLALTIRNIMSVNQPMPLQCVVQGNIVHDLQYCSGFWRRHWCVLLTNRVCLGKCKNQIF